MMHTKDMLAEALREAGLDEMADKAATGYYHDFLSPLALPEIELVNDLSRALLQESAANRPDRIAVINALRLRVINGDFDASVEESEAWADSPEGQATMRRLAEKP